MRGFLRLILTITIPLLLVIGSVRIVMSRAWLFWEYTRPGLTVDSYGFTTRDRWAYGPSGIDYLVEQRPIKYLADVRLPAAKCINPPVKATDCAAFTADELRHMQDVQRVTTAAFTAGLVALVAAALSGGLLWHFARRTCYVAVRDGSVLTLGLMAAVVVLASVAWDAFFDQFHEMFFTAGTWQFEYSQTLIRLYPEQFWYDAVLSIGVIVVISALGLITWSWFETRGVR